LSSAGESYNCLSNKVRKIPLDIHCTEMDYDITRPQLQLYYTDDFKKLEDTIDELASGMSYKVGGVESLKRAQIAGTVTTSQVETGLQLSGVLKSYVTTSSREICLLEFEGPSQLAFSEHQIAGHGPASHQKGLVCALGQADQDAIGKFKLGQRVNVYVDTGLEVNGVFTEFYTDKRGKVFATFKDYKLRLNSKELVTSTNTLVIPFAKKVTSVFGGAADRASFIDETGSKFAKPRAPKVNATPENRDLIPLYAEVRMMREGGRDLDAGRLGDIVKVLEVKHPHDWLLRLEILELVGPNRKFPDIAYTIKKSLEEISAGGAPRQDLIERGLALFKQNS